MPDGGMVGGAPVAPSVSDIGAGQTPQPYMPPMGMGQVDPNQATTKPRQMPGDGGGNDNGGPEGVPENQSIDPAMNGAESGPTNDAQPNQPQVVQGRRKMTKILAMMRVARKENPGLTQREAYDLAKATIKAYPIVVQAAGENALDFGNRGRVRNGPLYNQLLEWADEMGQSRNQRSRQPSYQPRHTVPGQAQPPPQQPPMEGALDGTETGPPQPTPGGAGNAQVKQQRQQEGMIPDPENIQPVNLDLAGQQPRQPAQPVGPGRTQRILQTVERGLNVAERGSGVAERQVAPLVKKVLPAAEKIAPEVLAARNR